MMERGRLVGEGGGGVPDLPDDKFDLLCEVERCRERSPDTAAVVGVAAGGVAVAAVARHLLLTAGAGVERETDLPSSQGPAHSPVFNTDLLQFQTLKAWRKVSVFTLC